MSTFTFNVVETIAVAKLNTVSAATEAEAREKAEIGDADSEEVLQDRGVIDRTIEEG